MPPRVPTEADFEPLKPALNFTLTWPKPAELTTSFLIVFHGLGDSETNFKTFAEGLNLPGVLCITVRGTTPLPGVLLGGEDDGSVAAGHFMWGDDLKFDPSSDELDPDPGFERARGLVLDKLVRDTLVGKLGWSAGDVMLFGFGEGGSLALGLASQLRLGPEVEDVTESDTTGTSSDARGGKAFKGVVSLGGPLPRSMVPSVSAREKAKSRVLVCQLEEDDEEFAKEEFESVEVLRWKRKGVGMPQEKDEMFPIMKFFSESMKGGW